MSQTEDQANSPAKSPKKSADGNPGEVAPRRSDGKGEADGTGGADGGTVEGDVRVDGLTADGRLPSSDMRSYALLTPELKNLYMGFYKATYGKSLLDIKTKEFVAIAASLTSGCKGCLEGHLKKAKKVGATSGEIAEVIAVTLGVGAASIVDMSDIANYHLGGLFDKPDE